MEIQFTHYDATVSFKWTKSTSSFLCWVLALLRWSAVKWSNTVKTAVRFVFVVLSLCLAGIATVVVGAVAVCIVFGGGGLLCLLYTHIIRNRPPSAHFNTLVLSSLIWQSSLNIALHRKIAKSVRNLSSSTRIEFTKKKSTQVYAILCV